MTPSPHTTTPIRLLIVGASGAVGQHVLAAALADPRIAQVTAPTRRALPAHAKLNNPVIDFSHLPAHAPWWQVDAVICTLGTTIKAAGSQAAFAAVDRDLPVKVAQLARAAGASRFALNSSLGANPTGNFYLRTKAQAEAGIRALAYPSYTVVRPSLIDARRDEPRLAEQIALAIARVLRPLIPRRYRAVKAEHIAQALLEAVLTGQPGEHIVESEALQRG
jgi:uncharacterized protein YbjT (DUF2867 family)